MVRRTVDLDLEIVALAREALGTRTLNATIDGALQYVITDAGRREFIDFAASGAFAELLGPGAEERVWS